ncbi:MAG TPA: hypothetical protein VJP84_06320 [Steroidobacteraceae bacterium]|nr:hypothetical protein [Steroidobacteraceae bacterium]
MKLLSVAACLCVAALAHARPQVIEETSRFPTPDPEFYMGPALAIDGDEAVVTGTRGYIDDEGYSNSEARGFLFRRSGTKWLFVKRLGEGHDYGIDDMHTHYGAAMSNGLMALAMTPFNVFEKRNGEWVAATVVGGGSDSVNGDDVVIEGNRIFNGGLSWGGVTFERNTAGEWRVTEHLYGDNSGDDDSAHGGPSDMLTNWAAVLNPYNFDEYTYGPAPAITTWLKTGTSSTSWVQQERVVPPEGHTFSDVALHRDSAGNYRMFAPDYNDLGTAVYAPDASGHWSEAARLHSAGEFMGSPYPSRRTHEVTRSGQYLFRRVWDYDRQAYVLEVFLPNANGFWTHRATLAASGGADLGRVSASGTRVIAMSGSNVLYFTMPAAPSTPAVIQDTFATGNGAGWTPVPGSQWAVVQSGGTRVYRQSNTAGNAGAVLDTGDWKNQSIQADVKPTAFDGNDRWVGLATRRTDASNYYYVSLRSSGIVVLRRMLNAQFTTIASAPFQVTLNRNYRLRLESIGTRHRVYIDGAPVLDADDGNLTHGYAALVMYRAAADYDNVVVTPNNLTTIYAQKDANNSQPPVVNELPWVYAGGTWSWHPDGSNMVLTQSALGGDARAATGPLNEVESDADQVVEARTRLGSFGSATDPWFGIMARYRDPQNYLYLSLRKSNTLTLRRVINGQITQLGTVTFTVTPGTWYRLRLDAVGSRVRAYVNGRLRIEATDPQPSNGRTGLLTFRTAADFDDYNAIRP